MSVRKAICAGLVIGVVAIVAAFEVGNHSERYEMAMFHLGDV